jgi:hypothetical protein
VLTIVLGLTAGEPLPSRRAGRPAEHHHREHASLEQLGRVDRYTEIMTAEPDRHVAPAQFVAHLVIFPDQLGVAQILIRHRIRSV